MRGTEDRRPSNVERVISLIIRRIREGEYLPGQHIVARNLCLELELSKAPVREALHVLAGDRVVEILPNKGARIRRLAKKDLLDFVVFWGAVGGVNARLASERIQGEDELVRIEEQLKRVISVAVERRPYKYFLAISNFHRILSEIANNVYITDFISRFHFEHYHRHIAEYLPGPHWEQHLERFKVFGEAVLGGEGERAEELFREHLAEVDRILRKEMGESEARPEKEARFVKRSA